MMLVFVTRRKDMFGNQPLKGELFVLFLGESSIGTSKRLILKIAI